MVDQIEIREMMLGFILDEQLCKLEPKTKAKKYILTEIRKVTKRHFMLAKRNLDLFNEVYECASEAWIQSQTAFIKDGLQYSIVTFILILLDKEDWMIKRYKLNVKSFNKLRASYDLSKHNFRSMKVVNEVLRQMDISSAQYSYRKNNE